jgi:NADH:ubiquinone oxidoreductase subunit B-like Fe-S oxidoreductase
MVGERLEDVYYPFKKVCMETILPDALHVHAKGSCSACENAFLISCQLLEKVPSRPVDVYIGKWLVEECVTAAYRKIGFGSCCPGNLGFDKIIKGCPPYPFALQDYLQSIGVV